MSRRRSETDCQRVVPSADSAVPDFERWAARGRQSVDAAGVTELKTPLATILLHAEAALELLNQRATSPGATLAMQRRLRAIIRQTFRCSRMVQELVETAHRGRAKPRF